MNVEKTIEFWKMKLRLYEWEIVTEEIEREQVSFPDDISDEDRFFVGVAIQEENKIAIISHDRDLTEEDIVHELLHVAYPDRDEEWINKTTAKSIGVVEKAKEYRKLYRHEDKGIGSKALEIADGWKNVFKSSLGITSEKDEKIFKARREICDACDHRTIKDRCGLCQCPLHAKTKSLTSNCPIGAW